MTDTTAAISFIEAILESQYAHSALWLATKLNTSVSVAQNSMDAYARLNNKVDKKIIVSGFCKDTGNLNVSLMNGTDLHSIQLQDIIVHTYSIGKYGLRNMNQIVQNSDEKLLHDCLNSEVGLPYLNSVGGIKLRNLEVRNVGERVFSHPSPAMVAVQDEAAKHIDAVFVSKPTAVRKAKSSIDVTNFFSRADSLKQPEEGVSPPATDIAGSAQPVAEKEKEKGKEKEKEKKKERKHSDDGDEEEWEGEEEKPAKKGKAGADRHASKPTAAKPAPPRPDCRKEEQSKRENLQGQQEKEQAGQGEGEGQGEEQQAQEQEVSRSPAPAQQRRKRKEVLHGAMDDFMAEKEPPRGDGATIVAPSDRPPRGKRRRLVEKVSAWWWSRFRSLSALSPLM